MKKWLTMLALVLAMLALPVRAGGDESVDALATSIGITEEPEDYIVVVDTSESMRFEGRWERAREALVGLLTNLAPDDYLTLITFDDGARTVWQGARPEDPTVLLDELPATPAGDQTDIGAAIDEAVKALQRDGARPVTALALLTDGSLDAAEDSPYATADTAAWEDLRTRAQQAANGRHVGAFALSLGNDTDAGLLTSVFPEAAVATPGDIVGYLSGLDEELKRSRVVEEVSTDLQAPPTLNATLAGVDAQTATIAVTVASSAQHVPISVTEVRLQPAVEGATIEPLAAPVEVLPGESAEFSVQAKLPEPGSYDVGLEVTLGSPWAGQLTELGVSPSQTVVVAPVEVEIAEEPAAAPAPAPEAEAETPEPEASASWLPVVGAVVGGILLVAALALLLLRRRGGAEGSMTITAKGQPVDEFVLDGSRTFDRSGVKLQVVARKEGGVQVRGKVDGEQFSGELTDGETMNLPGERTLTYTSERSRMLDLVNAKFGGR
ncbi:vWA domain-containing protein [Tessaracoccus oleiagri]|uniref:von Willebrand factor type A domain-containing protein n=1 Tax=Tessaracoccus oleiagri TaxID=686624 RepID=A0A1G9JVV6_9ACTN|nr:vWA domain-containing protein [Tessaracoccus oleiagri]SDL40983.1 von Willebrand factor type A domain-containing protein [Tessaracoccus oleiagri]